ncbi:heterokaryon incompatibility protein-domain-containing protein [Xylaria sp. FL1777]|nr:heterokaryon incompatibility protein-domain-containing protein [Xylaria sp. FL1777]
MNNHILRHGLMNKKTGDGSRRIHLYTHSAMFGPRLTWKANLSIPSNSSHGSCGFNHHPYMSYEHDSIDEEDEHIIFSISTTLEHAKQAATQCEFCHTIWLGIQRYRWLWQERVRMLEYQEFERFGQFSYIRDEEIIKLTLNSPRKEGYLEACLWVEQETYRVPLVTLEYYTIEGKPSSWCSFQPSPQVSANVLSNAGLAKFRSWIQDCVETHPSCHSIIQQDPPARLLRIDTSTNSGRPAVKLCLVNPQEVINFIALSYCWGNTTPIKTTTMNIQQRLAGIDWDELPKLYQDTIVLSMALGIQYVWIDSLCILQGNHADWLTESPKMASIYGNAYVVFAAHGHELALVKENRLCAVEKEDHTAGDETHSVVFVRDKIKHEGFVDFAKSPRSWFGRAWCFQERLFASRILHFGGQCEEVTFECNTTLHCECGAITRLNRAGAQDNWDHPKARLLRALESSQELEPQERVDKLWQLFLDCCEIFTSQYLTNSQDCLVALSSLARCLSPQLGCYFFGLWEHNILIGLQWESHDARECHRHKSYVAPSFSWASRAGPCVWYISTQYLIPDTRKCNFAQVLDVYCDDIPRGSSYIKLRGYTTTMHFEDIEGCYALGKLKIFKDHPPSSRVAEPARMENKLSSGAHRWRTVFKQLRSWVDVRQLLRLGDKIRRWKESINRMRTKSITTDSEPSDQEEIYPDNTTEPEECCWVCIDTIEDLLVARGKPVTCLDIMRDKNGDNPFVSALVLEQLEDHPGSYRRIGFSTMTAEFFENSQPTDVIII